MTPRTCIAFAAAFVHLTGGLKSSVTRIPKSHPQLFSEPHNKQNQNVVVHVDGLVPYAYIVLATAVQWYFS